MQTLQACLQQSEQSHAPHDQGSPGTLRMYWLVVVWLLVVGHGLAEQPDEHLWQEVNRVN